MWESTLLGEDALNSASSFSILEKATEIVRLCQSVYLVEKTLLNLLICFEDYALISVISLKFRSSRAVLSCTQICSTFLFCYLSLQDPQRG